MGQFLQQYIIKHRIEHKGKIVLFSKEAISLAQERLHLFALLGFMSTVNYWSAWRLQQGVFGQLSHFALDNRCNFSGLWGAWNGFTSRCQSSLHPEYSIFQGIIQNPWDRSLPGGIWAYLNIVCQIFFWVLRRHLYLSRHAWWFESWRCPKGHSPHLRSRTNPPFG